MRKLEVRTETGYRNMTKKEIESIKQTLLGGDIYTGKRRGLFYNSRNYYQLIDKDGTPGLREFNNIKEALQYCI